MGWVQTLLTIGTMVFVSGSTIGVLIFQSKEFQRRMGSMEAEMKQMQQILINQARSEVRLDAMDERLNAQGLRLDKAISDFTSGQNQLARMVEACISRMNDFIDDLAKARRRNDGTI